jgi:hypothetical protein
MQMVDRYDSPISISRPVRILLGVTALFGATFLLIGGLVGDTSRAESQYQILFARLGLPLMGLGFGYVGFRLVLIKDGDRLLSSMASLAIGILFVTLGLAITPAVCAAPSITGLLSLAFFVGVGIRLCLPWIRERS